MFFRCRLLLAAFALCFASQAYAQVFAGETLFVQRNNYWQSFLLVLPESVFTRAVTSSTDASGVALSLDFLPPACEPEMRFNIPLPVSAEKDNFRNDLLVSLRTDQGSRVNLGAVSMVTMGDIIGIVYLDQSSNLMGQIGEMSRGRTLRVKIMFGEDERGALYDTFSLIGMTAAFRRASKMCSDPASFRN